VRRRAFRRPVEKPVAHSGRNLRDVL